MCSANTMGRFETQMLSVEDNLQALSEVNGRWVERALEKTTHRRIILDMDSSASPVHGEQEASGYNGHFGCTQPTKRRSEDGAVRSVAAHPGGQRRELLKNAADHVVTGGVEAAGGIPTLLTGGTLTAQIAASRGSHSLGLIHTHAKLKPQGERAIHMGSDLHVVGLQIHVLRP